ncbi:MAG: hypothetical protein J6S85_10675 [Methanobrevibacter sp.]|nr:hypothetical protein [Methanobrevibacter sp.]
MKNGLMTIKEFAEAVGQTQQAIYKQLNKRLTKYVILDNGQKYIKSEAVGLYEEQQDNNKYSTREQQLNNKLNENERLIEAKSEQIKTLQSELEEKNRQIKFLQDQLADITAALKASQSIQAIYMQQIEDKKSAEQEQEQQQQKKGLFARIFSRKENNNERN